MGLEACRLACRFVKEQTVCRTVVDPFCGRGTVLAAANEQGLDAVGVELAKKRARQAKALTVAGVESAGHEDGSKQ
jgi:tRNA G10  N-methylase Trm11